jgi:hypothetical protein
VLTCESIGDLCWFSPDINERFRVTTSSLRNNSLRLIKVYSAEPLPQSPVALSCTKGVYTGNDALLEVLLGAYRWRGYDDKRPFMAG